MKHFKSSLRTDLRLVIRTMKLIHKLQPFMITLSFFAGLASSFYPFINLFFSSLILTELSSVNRSLQKLTTYIILLLILNFFGTAIKDLLNQTFDTFQYILSHKKELYLTNKGYQLDYADMENPEIRQLRERLYRHRYSSGLIALVYQIYGLVHATTVVIISTTIVLQMLLFKCNDTNKLARFINSPWATILWISIIAFALIYIMKTNSNLKKANYEVMEKSSPHQNYSHFYSYHITTEYNTGKDVRLYHQIPLIHKELHHHLSELFQLNKYFQDLVAKYGSICGCIRICINLLVYLFVAVKALLGAFGIGNIILYSDSVNRFGDGFSQLLNIFAEMRRNCESLQWFYDYIDLENRKETGTIEIDLAKAKDYVVEFKDVSFKYPSSDIYSLEHVSIRFNIGERVAVVGKNGSGKTTFIKLLCRLYDPQEGEILLNGINIKEYNYQDYLAMFSVVFQDFQLFSFTLGENVATASDYDESIVLDALNKAGLEQRIERFPDGVNTQLYNEFAEVGVEISGGEAQKVSIARALYKDAPFIVLDEPTAALDPIAEADIYNRLNELIQDKTAIYISHRLSSCYFCQQIAVFDEGSLIQHGSHKELIEDKNGLYYELWNAQAQYYA